MKEKLGLHSEEEINAHRMREISDPNGKFIPTVCRYQTFLPANHIELVVQVPLSSCYESEIFVDLADLYVAVFAKEKITRIL